jgi:hypothetical protein
MSQQKKESVEPISLTDFDPNGPRDKILNTPRSLEACKQLGINPEDLFIFTKEELNEHLDEQNISEKHRANAIQEYYSGMEEIFQNLMQKREELMPSSKNPNKKKQTTAKSQTKVPTGLLRTNRRNPSWGFRQIANSRNPIQKGMKKMGREIVTRTTSTKQNRAGKIRREKS